MHGNPEHAPGRPKHASTPLGGSEQGERGGHDLYPHSDKHWAPKVISLSALLGQGVDTFWKAVCEFQTLQTANGLFRQRRQNQSLAWMWERIDAGLKQAFKQNESVQALLPQHTQAVLAGQMAASTAARELLQRWSQG